MPARLAGPPPEPSFDRHQLARPVGRSAPAPSRRRQTERTSMKRLIGTIVLAALLCMATSTVALAKGGNSAAAKACQKGGYLGLVGAGGETFRNTGGCVSFAAHGGKFATGIIVREGDAGTCAAPPA